MLCSQQSYMRLFKNRGLFAASSEEPQQVGPAFERGRNNWPLSPCLELGGRQTIATFTTSWVSSVILRFTMHKRVVMGETKLFKALNRLLRKMIQCLKAFGMPHAGDPCWSGWKWDKISGQTCIKQPFNKPIANAFLKVQSFKCSQLSIIR